MKINGKEYKPKVVQLAVGCDLLGSKMSLSQSHNTDLITVEDGVAALSKKSNRIMFVPYTNIKGMELFPSEEILPAGKEEEAFQVDITGAKIKPKK
jgi:hypothetical protein